MLLIGMIKISSIITKTNLSNCMIDTKVIRFINITGILAIPNGITTYS